MRAGEGTCAARSRTACEERQPLSDWMTSTERFVSAERSGTEVLGQVQSACQRPLLEEFFDSAFRQIQTANH